MRISSATPKHIEQHDRQLGRRRQSPRCSEQRRRRTSRSAGAGPVTVPYSRPVWRMRSPMPSVSSVGKGPRPTLVAYALTTPTTRSRLRAGTPEPLATPADELFELVTNGYVP